MTTALSLPLPLTDSITARLASPPEESGWARAASGGDKAAFGRLVERHKASVYGLCYRLLGSTDEARDAAQETLVRAYLAMAEFDDAQPFGAWALRIARNHCIDQLRRRRPMVALGEPRGEDLEPGTMPELPYQRAMGGEQAMQEREAQRDLDTAIGRLPPRYREVISLFHVHHKSYAEIAEVMSVPMGTVMTWLHRARKELRTQMSEHLS